MHKNDAARLFGVLGDGDRVKMMKFLSVRGDLTADELYSIAGTDPAKFLADSNALKDAGLLKLEKKEGVLVYSANRELVDELMSFIVTPCGCSRP